MFTARPDNIKVVNITTGKLTEYGTIDQYLDNASDEMYKGNIALPNLPEAYIQVAAQEAIDRYKQMTDNCITIADKANKRGLIVYCMQWTSPKAYIVKAYDAINGHKYFLEKFKSYSENFEIIDEETMEYMDSSKFYPYIDWEFCRDYFIPLAEEIYELRTPIDSRFPSPTPIKIPIEGIDVNKYGLLYEAIDYINTFRATEDMDLTVDRVSMYKLEYRVHQLLKFVKLGAPPSICDDEVKLILKAYCEVLGL